MGSYPIFLLLQKPIDSASIANLSRRVAKHRMSHQTPTTNLETEAGSVEDHGTARQARP